MKARTAFNKDMASASDDSSADEDVEHPSTAPAPDADIAYSYDASRGPTHGSQIGRAARRTRLIIISRRTTRVDMHRRLFHAVRRVP